MADALNSPSDMTFEQIESELDDRTTRIMRTGELLDGEKDRVTSLLCAIRDRFPVRHAERNGDAMLAMWQAEIDWGNATRPVKKAGWGRKRR